MLDSGKSKLSTMQKIIIAAVNEIGVIGRNKEMPWSIRADLKNFKTQTGNYPQIMGRETFESIIMRNKKPLPDRVSIVISTTMEDTQFEEVKVVRSFEEGISFAESLNTDRVFLIGGTRVFQDGIRVADKMLLTRVFSEDSGDAFFPDYNEDEWQTIKYEKHEKDEKNSHDFAFTELVRK
jgi:dihydrofolate reductase